MVIKEVTIRCKLSLEYLELEQKKKELETKVATALEKKDFELARELCDKLEAVVAQM